MQSSPIERGPSTDAQPRVESRACPTRHDGAESLIAQTISEPQCQDRQRRSYHKCWTCAHRNDARSLKPVPKLGLADPVPRASAI